MSSEAEVRAKIVAHGRSLSLRGYGPGSSGNIAVKVADGVLVTPTGTSLGLLDAGRLAKVDRDGRHLSGDQPSKEAYLHLLMFRARPDAGAVVHLHSTYCVALSCLADVDAASVLPPLTAYFVMRVGRLPLVPFHPPGDPALAEAVATAAREHHAVLLANHGPVVAGRDLDQAVFAIEELEETARLHLLLRGHKTRLLDETQVRSLQGLVR